MQVLIFLPRRCFFDNNLYYDFLDRVGRMAIDAPVIPGIMPITSVNQIDRVISLSGSLLPREFLNLVERYGSDAVAMHDAGVDYAMRQIRNLFDNGVKNVHVYTMNKPNVAKKIIEML